jgi:hypothetical protein
VLGARPATSGPSFGPAPTTITGVSGFVPLVTTRPAVAGVPAVGAAGPDGASCALPDGTYRSVPQFPFAAGHGARTG